MRLLRGQCLGSSVCPSKLDSEAELESNIAIKLRGKSSLNFAKKSFTFELRKTNDPENDRKASLAAFSLTSSRSFALTQ